MYVDKRLTDLDKCKYRNTLPLRSKLLRLIWGLIWALFFRPTPSWCLNGWRTNLLRCFGAAIGKKCRIASSVKVWAPWNLHAGAYVCLGDHVDCYNVAPIQIGNKVTVSQGAVLCTASHDIRFLEKPLTQDPIFIGDYSWVCADAFIGPGVNVSEGAVVGARGVVFKDVDPWVVVAGNPASVIKKRELEGDK